MIRKTPPKQQNSMVILIIGAAVVGILLLSLGVIIGSGIGGRSSPLPTDLPPGFAQTAIALTLAAYPTNTVLPSPSPTITIAVTNTPFPSPTLIPTQTKQVYIPINVTAAPQYITLPDGSLMPASAAITPVATYEYVMGCDTSCTATGVTCKTFGNPSAAQICYDLCRADATICKDLENNCDPWGLDASDGSLDTEHWVCGFGDAHLND